MLWLLKKAAAAIKAVPERLRSQLLSLFRGAAPAPVVAASAPPPPPPPPAPPQQRRRAPPPPAPPQRRREPVPEGYNHYELRVFFYGGNGLRERPEGRVVQVGDLWYRETTSIVTVPCTTNRQITQWRGVVVKVGSAEWDRLIEEALPLLERNAGGREEAASLFLRVVLGYDLSERGEYCRIVDVESDPGNIPLRPDQRLVGRAFADTTRVEYLNSPYIHNQFSYQSNRKGFEFLFEDPYKSEWVPNDLNGGCVIKCILLQFKEGWDKEHHRLRRGTSKRKWPLLTAEWLIQLFEAKEPDYAVTIPTAIERFFKPYKLSLIVYDRDAKLLEECSYDLGTKVTHKIGSAVLRVIASNGHFYRINKGASSLAQKKDGEVKQWIQDVSAMFYLPREEKALKVAKKEPVAPVSVHFVKDITQIGGIDFNLGGRYKFVTETPLHFLLYYLYKHFKVLPDIQRQGNDMVSSMTVVIGKSSVSFTNPGDSKMLQALKFETEAQYLKYNAYYERQQKAVITLQNLSWYGEDWLVNAFHSCPKALLGLVSGAEVKDGVKLHVADIAKEYSQAVNNLRHYCVVGTFDRWRKWDGGWEGLKPHYFYTVERVRAVEGLAWVFLNQRYVSYPGSLLTKYRELLEPFGKVMAYCSVSNVHKTSEVWKGVIREMYADQEMPTRHKKYSTNMVCGLLERSVNRRSVNKLFADQCEAIEHRQRLMDLCPDLDARVLSFNLIDYEADAPPTDATTEELLCFGDDQKPLWLLTKASETTMINGFYPIKCQIYADAREQLYHLCQFVTSELEGRIVAVKTDAVYFETEKKYTPKTYADIGGYTYQPCVEEKDTIPSVPLERVVKGEEDWEFKALAKGVIPFVSLDSESDWKEAGGSYVSEAEAWLNGSQDHVLLEAEVPGAGKTWLALELARRSGKKCVFASVSNRRCNELKKAGILNAEVMTLHHLLGIRLNDDGEQEQKKGVDLSEVELLLIDEIYLANLMLLGKLTALLEKYPEVRLIATGDAEQQRIDDFKTDDNTAYLREAVSLIFGAGLKLKVNKRMENVEDQVALLRLKDALIGHSGEEWRELVQEVTSMEQVYEMVRKGGLGICYTHKSRRELNALFSQQCGREGCVQRGVFWVKVGMRLTAQKRLWNNRVFKNEEGVVTEVREEGVVVTFSGGRVEVAGLKYLEDYSCLEYGYVNTAVATQGDTYDRKLIVFDTRHFGMTKNAIYTSLSRVKRMSDVYVWNGVGLEGMFEVRGIKDCQDRMRTRIESHKRADRDANRWWVEGLGSYVDEGWVLKSFEAKPECWWCAEDLSLDHDDSECCYSIDRIDDSKPHLKSNCRLACHHCNVSRRNVVRVEAVTEEGESEEVML